MWECWSELPNIGSLKGGGFDQGVVFKHFISCGFLEMLEFAVPPCNKKLTQKNYFRGHGDTSVWSIAQSNSLRIIFSGATWIPCNSTWKSLLSQQPPITQNILRELISWWLRSLAVISPQKVHENILGKRFSQYSVAGECILKGAAF